MHGITIATATLKKKAVTVDKSKANQQGVAFLMGSDKQYNPLHAKLANTFMLGEDKYTLSTTEAYNLLLNWWGESTMQRLTDQQDKGQMTFHWNDGEEGDRKSKNKKDRLELLCYRYGQYKEQYANECPYTDDEEDKMKSAGTGKNPEKASDAMLSMHIGTDEDASQVNKSKDAYDLNNEPSSGDDNDNNGGGEHGCAERVSLHMMYRSGKLDRK